MARTGPGNCSVCSSKHRHQIDLGITHGISRNVLAERFGLHKDAIARHSANHLSPAQRAALLTATQPTAIDLEALRTSESEGLLAGLVAQRARLLVKGDLAAELGDLKTSISAESAIATNYQLVAKLLGQLINIHDVRHTNLLVSPDYLKLRDVLVTVLRRFPDAAKAVADAMHRLESDAAREITAGAKPAAPLVIDAQPPPAPPCPVPLQC